MSAWATTWAYEQDVKPCGKKAVLVALAHFADAEGFCYPSQETLAIMTSQGVSTVRTHMETLEQEGIIKRQHRYKKGKRTSDGVVLQAPAERLQPQRHYRRKSAEVQNDLPPEKVCTTAEKPAPLPPKSGDDLSVEQSVNKKTKERVFSIEELKDPDTIPGLRNQLAIYSNVPFDDAYKDWYAKYEPMGGIGRRPGAKCTLAQYAARIESYFRTWERNANSRNGNNGHGAAVNDQPMMTIKERIRLGLL